MKSYFLICTALIALMTASCKEESSVSKVFEPTCEITSPEDGASFKMEDDIVISGNGSIENGKIVKTVLRINDEVVNDVNTVPFDYTLTEPYKKEGKLEIILDVTADNNMVASDTVDIEIAGEIIMPTCKITSPENGANFLQSDEIVISGVGEVESGSITKTVLKINDEVVSDVTTVPFDYTVTEQYKKVGNLDIVLEVTSDKNQVATDQITIAVISSEGECLDVRDGKTYKTVQIGDQVWFAENCAYLPSVNNASESSNEEARYYVYNYDGNNVDEAKASNYYESFGVLYNWFAAGGNKDSKPDDNPSGIQGPCPAGWHVPSEAEWEVLFNYVRDRIPDEDAVLNYKDEYEKNVNGRLRAVSGWPTNYDSEYPELNEPGTDEYGFNAIVAGYYVSGFSIASGTTYFYTPYYDDIKYPSSPGGSYISISSSFYEPSRGVANVSKGYSVRCVKD